MPLSSLSLPLRVAERLIEQGIHIYKKQTHMRIMRGNSLHRDAQLRECIVARMLREEDNTFQNMQCNANAVCACICIIRRWPPGDFSGYAEYQG